MNKNNYQICRIDIKDMPVMIDWMKQEGWNPGLDDAECFFSADNNGFFAGKLGDEIIAVASAVVYDAYFAFCGCYIVKPQYRSQGYGMALTKARLDYVGKRTTGIDGVLEMVPQYAKIGYESQHNNLRYVLNKKYDATNNTNIIVIDKDNFAAIQNYDRLYFPADRVNFLNCWLYPKFGKALAFIENNQIKGYGVIRKCFSGYKIGPLFADSFEIAEQLFLNLISELDELPVFLDIPKPNAGALKLVEKYGMKPVFETIRMYRNKPPQLNLKNIYGITTFELG